MNDDTWSGFANSFCGQASAPRTPVTIWTKVGPIVARATRKRYFICTQNPHHQGVHAACDGQGHILAQWSAEVRDQR